MSSAAENLNLGGVYLRAPMTDHITGLYGFHLQKNSSLLDRAPTRYWHGRHTALEPQAGLDCVRPRPKTPER